MLVRRLRTVSVALVGFVMAAGLIVVASPQAVALDAPTNPSPSGAQTGIPTFSWDRVAGATTYDFQISTSDQFNTTLVNVTTVQRQYVPKIQLPTQTQLYWRVRGTGGGETWTTTLFSRNTVGAPTLIGPADAAELAQPDNPVTLSWQPVPGADAYDVQYGTDPNFVDQTTTKSVEGSSYVVPLQTPGTYVWRVRGVLANGVFTAWSGGTSPLPPARTYKVLGLDNDSGIPPTSPPDDPNQALTDVVLDWEPIKGAKSYEIQISTDQEFPAGTIVDSKSTVYGTRYSPPETLDNDQYFWRIRATDAAGFEPDWSTRPRWRFKRTWPDQPTLLYPQNNATNVQAPFYYQWTPVKHASSYVVQISSGGGGSPRLRRSRRRARRCTRRWCTATALATAGPLCPAPTPGGSRPGTSSPTRYPSPTGSPHRSGPSPTSRSWSRPPRPPSGSIFADPYDPIQSLGAPVLKWNPVAGADKYRVTISGTTTQSFTTAALSYAPRDLAPGTYSWDVQTVDALGSVGAGHDTGQRTFTIKQHRWSRTPTTPGRSSRCRCPTRCPPPVRRTRPSEPGLVVPFPVASTGAQSAGSTTTSSGWRARATPSRRSRATSNGQPATTPAPPGSTPGTTSGM